jgi:hypothetical protein
VKKIKNEHGLKQPQTPTSSDRNSVEARHTFILPMVYVNVQPTKATSAAESNYKIKESNETPSTVMIVSQSGGSDTKNWECAGRERECTSDDKIASANGRSNMAGLE